MARITGLYPHDQHKHALWSRLVIILWFDQCLPCKEHWYAISFYRNSKFNYYKPLLWGTIMIDQNPSKSNVNIPLNQAIFLMNIWPWWLMTLNPNAQQGHFYLMESEAQNQWCPFLLLAWMLKDSRECGGVGRLGSRSFMIYHSPYVVQKLQASRFLYGPKERSQLNSGEQPSEAIPTTRNVNSMTTSLLP